MTNHQPAEIFTYCPQCACPDIHEVSPRHLVCGACGLHFFINIATACGAIIVDNDGRILLIRRAKEPGKGKFGIPGGFCEAGETVEESLTREVWEEVGLRVTALNYLASFPNTYRYKGIAYPTLDLFFVCHVDALHTAGLSDEVTEIIFLPNSD